MPGRFSIEAPDTALSSKVATIWNGPARRAQSRQ
jgi:hypothetical protein